MKYIRSLLVTFWLLAIIVLLPQVILATTPLPQKDLKILSQPLDRTSITAIRYGAPRIPKRDLDDYIGKFNLLCNFLAGMQEPDSASGSFGGMHEGETGYLWDIIETDNTQEAIKVWSEYALYFGDSDAYRENVDAAWAYCTNFPAWEEGPNDYYSWHNDGWGLMAEMAYRQAYGDDHADYGHSCADDIVNTAPDITPDMQNPLFPLVVGWDAGTLYLYAEYKGNAEWRDKAVALAGAVKDWIDANPDRLNANEVWALCGGTAMWGVLTALGREDSTATANWSSDILENMDVFAGQGQWNNSWNIWYAHAWIESWKLTGNDDYLGYATAIVDSLLKEDGDHDGGIPATGGDADDIDQSWVTAYTGWMGLTNLIKVLPEFNIGLISLSAPSVVRPWPAGTPLSFSFVLRNESFTESYDFPFRIRGPIDFDTTAAVTGWGEQSLTLPDVWAPIDSGTFGFLAYSDLAEDGDHINDSLRFELRILPTVEINLRAMTPDSLAIMCRFDFYNQEINPDSVFASLEADSASGVAAGMLMTGHYRMAAVPLFPYCRRFQDVEIVADSPLDMSLTFVEPPILLINGDLDSAYMRYYSDALDSLKYEFYGWDLRQDGTVTGIAQGFPIVIYFTGDHRSNSMPDDVRQELTRHQANGGNIFVTGQDIADNLSGTSTLRDLLHAEHLADDANVLTVLGIAGDAITDGMSLLLVGNKGANNQHSPAGIAPVNGGTACAYYRNIPDTAAAVRWELDTGARGVFFAFGFEGISGMGGTTSRPEVLAAVLNYLGINEGIRPQHEADGLPMELELSAYPNPTNGNVELRLNQGANGGLRLLIFDLQGRIVQTLQGNRAGCVSWDGKSNGGTAVAGGLYFIAGVDDKGNLLTNSIRLAYLK